MSRVTLQNRRKYKKIFSDAVNICLDSLKKDQHYYVSRLGCSKSISPLAARLSIKLSGHMKEIIKEIELETFDEPVIKSDDDFLLVDENAEFEMDDVNDSDQEENKYNLHRRLDPLLNVLIEENHDNSIIDASTNENTTPREPDICGDNNRSGVPSESSSVKTDSVKTLKNKQLTSTGLLKKQNCPKAIPIRKRVQIFKPISSNVDKGKQQVSKPVDKSSSSTANNSVVIEKNSRQINPEHIVPHVIISELPLRQQSPSQSTSEQSPIKKVDAHVSKTRYTAESESDDDNITLVINKKTNNAKRQNPIQIDDELEEFSPNDSDDNTMTTKGSPKKQPARVTRSSNERSPKKQPVRVTRSSARLTQPAVKYNLCSSTSEDDKTSSSSSEKSDDESEALSTTTASTTTTNNNSVKRQRAKRGGKKKIDTKKSLSQTTIHHPTWTLQRAKKRGRYNGKTDIQKMKFWSQRRDDIDKLNELVYAKCIELKNEDSKITDGRIFQIAMEVIEKSLPKNFHLSRTTWRNEFLNKYNITGKPSERLIEPISRQSARLGEEISSFLMKKIIKKITTHEDINVDIASNVKTKNRKRSTSSNLPHHAGSKNSSGHKKSASPSSSSQKKFKYCYTDSDDS
ncbi:uncharacterized protein LOC122849417 [Aphidius gifuensis]|uniref:uncharacterized protein LOC122849417 n=1 Tax=Aphidius gifuensis TaxID=684658 RepID=UPI001CDC2C09|nr:uncharacterized protein LOC122849417 [Aphidius gifuensis]